MAQMRTKVPARMPAIAAGLLAFFAIKPKMKSPSVPPVTIELIAYQVKRIED